MRKVDMRRVDSSYYFDRYFKGSEKTAILLITIILFIICYGLVFNSYLINHDSVNRIYDGIESTTSGRFMRKPLNDLLSFGTYNPINVSILLYILLTLNSFVFINLFKIEQLLTKTIIIATVYSFPLFGFFWFYGNDVWQYALAFLCMLLAVWFVTKNGLRNKLIAIALIVTGLGIYQAFLSVLTTVFTLKYIATALSEDEINWREYIKNFMILVTGAILYFIILKLILFVTGEEMLAYKGADQIGVKSIILNMPHSIYLAYNDTIKFIVAYGNMFNTYFNNWFINIILLSAYPVALLEAKSKGYSKQTLVSIAILMVFLPIMTNSSTFLISKVTEYAQFGYLPFMLGTIIYWLQFKHVNIRISMTYVIIIYIILSISLLNTMLFIEKAQSEQTFAIGQRLIFDIMATDGYEPNDQVEICGKLVYNQSYEPAPSTKYKITSKWLNPGSDTYLLKARETRHTKYLFKNLGYEINIVKGQSECSGEQMKQFPEDGYIVQVGEGEDKVYQVYLS